MLSTTKLKKVKIMGGIQNEPRDIDLESDCNIKFALPVRRLELTPLERVINKVFELSDEKPKDKTFWTLRLLGKTHILICKQTLLPSIKTKRNG